MVNEDLRNEALTELHVLIVAPEAPRCGSKGCPVCKALCGLDFEKGVLKMSFSFDWH